MAKILVLCACLFRIVMFLLIKLKLIAGTLVIMVCALGEV